VITRPHRATVGNPRCAPISAGSGTAIVPEYQRFLDELGITYRQWNHWQAMDWLPQRPWYKIANDPEMRQWAEDLATAAKLKLMNLPYLATYLADERKARESL
jgi:hypothetical protein